MTAPKPIESFGSFSDINYRERIAVIGGGIAGCLVARELSLEGYAVSIFEAGHDILDGTSAGALQGHLGGMYCGNLATAKECMGSTILYAKELPYALHTGREAQFLVAEASDMSMDGYIRFYDELRDHYADLPVEDQIFGPPENLYRVMEEHEHGYAKNVKGGIATREPGLDMLSLKAGLRRRFARLGVQLCLNTTVLGADENRGQFVLTTTHNDITEKVSFDQVVNAGGYRARLLDHSLGDRTKYHLYLKAWNFVRDGERFKDSEPLPPFFVVRGHYIHHSPVGNDDLISLVAANEGNSCIADMRYGDDAPELPAEWLEMMRRNQVPDKRRRQTSILDYAHDTFLKDRRVEPVDLRPGVAVSFSADRSNRLMGGVTTVRRGWQTAVPTKATNALNLAKEVAQNTRSHSIANGRRFYKEEHL